MYNPNALKAGIESCKANIRTFEDAIERENETIREYRKMIQHLEEKAAREPNVHIEVERE